MCVEHTLQSWRHHYVTYAPATSMIGVEWIWVLVWPSLSGAASKSSSILSAKTTATLTVEPKVHDRLLDESGSGKPRQKSPYPSNLAQNFRFASFFPNIGSGRTLVPLTRKQNTQLNKRNHNNTNQWDPFPISKSKHCVTSAQKIKFAQLVIENNDVSCAAVTSHPQR